METFVSIVYPPPQKKRETNHKLFNDPKDQKKNRPLPRNSEMNILPEKKHAAVEQ